MLADAEVPMASGKRKFEAPTCTNQVRRSSRKNKYDGFKTKMITYARVVKSKVEPRKVPTMPVLAVDGHIVPDVPGLQNEGENVPPPTPISIIQCIGVNLCGIPAEELSPKKLLASLQEEAEDSSF